MTGAPSDQSDVDSTPSRKAASSSESRQPGGFVNGFAIDVFARALPHMAAPAAYPRARPRDPRPTGAAAPTILLTNRPLSDAGGFHGRHRALKSSGKTARADGPAGDFTNTLTPSTAPAWPAGPRVYGGDGLTMETTPAGTTFAVARPVVVIHRHDAQLDAAVAELLKQVDAAGGNVVQSKTPAPATHPTHDGHGGS